MKHFLILFLIILPFSVEGQKSVYLYFNDAGFCGPGPIITEEITLFTDNSFEYFSSRYSNLRINASGSIARKDSKIELEYELITIDTLDKSRIKTEIVKLNLISEFQIKRDKQWFENIPGMLIECSRMPRKRIKLLAPGRNRILIIKTFDYELVNK
jgi:hypothetical protein